MASLPTTGDSIPVPAKRKPEGQILRWGKGFAFTKRRGGEVRTWWFPEFRLAQEAQKKREAEGWVE